MLIKPFSFLQQKIVSGGGGLPAINTSGLLVWLDANFPGGSPSTTWADNSGNGNDFTVTSAGTGTNPTLTTTLDEAYYQLTGVYSNPGVSTTQTGGGYFTRATDPLSSSMTLTVWLYPDINYSTSQTVGRWISGGGSGGRYFYGSGFGSTNYGWGGSTYNPSPMQHPAQSTWQEYTVTFTPSTNGGIQHYYNGSQYAQANTSAGSIATPKPIHIGKQYDALNEYFSGRIAIVLMYDRVLSAAEVAANNSVIASRYNY